ncbi:hypothetical protein PTD2_04416 [Pseudoalteromonas tunicata D2]|uniref:Uncharacterized protein n=1 Tax=Pseudoalteromonas tunicata D2 TaxID=87626 RepID=A4C5F4_9GAMM|nr:hypothetical protein PTD2_04416 [Pseudoalteromonas tunicata D2]
MNNARQELEQIAPTIKGKKAILSH